MFCAERQEVFFSLFFSTVYWMQKQMTVQSSLIDLINHKCIINGNKSHPSLCLCKWALRPPSLVLCIKGMPLKYRPVWVNTTMSCLRFFFITVLWGGESLKVAGGLLLWWWWWLLFRVCTDDETRKALGGCSDSWKWSHSQGNKVEHWRDHWQNLKLP